MKILAFAATNNLESINKKLIIYAAQILMENDQSIEFEILDLNDYEMIIYRPDREKEYGIPKQAQDFYQKITDADKVIISFAEYNGSYTAAYKNVFDWVSRINMKVYQDKPVFLMATSPGGRGGANVLRVASESAPFFGMNLKGRFSLPSFYENFDQKNDKIKNIDLDNNLKELLLEL
jgi:NAD(P)H-dependent FMN reductase